MLEGALSGRVDGADTNASEWFSDEQAHPHYLVESCLNLGGQFVLSLLWWQDEDHLMSYY